MGATQARHTPEDLKKIRQALVGMEYAMVNDQLGDEEDYAFHQAIVAATHNPHFKSLNEYLDHSVRRLIREARSNTAAIYNELIQAVQDEHQAIFQAIQARDPVRAGEAAERQQAADQAHAQWKDVDSDFAGLINTSCKLPSLAASRSMRPMR